jgi:hypothetical protein
MNINLPAKARFAVYAFLGIGSIVVTYLSAVGVIGQAEVTAWTALATFGSGLAALNVNGVTK